jgi:hypothetical protein
MDEPRVNFKLFWGDKLVSLWLVVKAIMDGKEMRGFDAFFGWEAEI